MNDVAGLVQVYQSHQNLPNNDCHVFFVHWPRLEQIPHRACTGIVHDEPELRARENGPAVPGNVIRDAVRQDPYFPFDVCDLVATSVEVQDLDGDDLSGLLVDSTEVGFSAMCAR
jgi:hypothetical protein